MRRFVTILGVALFGYALLPSFAQAQVIYVQPRSYVAPIYVSPPVVQSYYYAPSVTTYSNHATYSYYPSGTAVYTHSTYASPAVVTFAPPTAVLVPAAGVVTTHTSYGYGVFRPRGYYSQSYYTPLR